MFIILYGKAAIRRGIAVVWLLTEGEVTESKAEDAGQAKLASTDCYFDSVTAGKAPHRQIGSLRQHDRSV